MDTATDEQRMAINPRIHISIHSDQSVVCASHLSDTYITLIARGSIFVEAYHSLHQFTTLTWLKGLARAKIIKNSVILFRVLNMTI